MLYIEAVMMAVPENIRKDPRPINTIVEDNSREGPNRYAVHERHSVNYVASGNPQPSNEKVIGHITDDVYVPVRAATADRDPDMLSYGGATFVKSVSGDILRKLLSVYLAKDSYTIIAVASLKVLKPGIAANCYGTHYRLTYVSKYYPGVALSENTVCIFLQKLGQDGNKRREFYQKRALSVAQDHHIAIDGMLKQYTRTVNDLFEFS